VQRHGEEGDEMMWDGWGMGGGMIWGWLFLVLLLAGVVLLVVVVVRLLGSGTRRDAGPGPSRHPEGGGVGNERARQILAERYARGEIDGAEYDERLKRLRD
jgi:putative membrane protein